ncbi:hypothetical protein IJT93_10500 [bacterium]|nr:hypothetical protein [bacterium]
MSKGYSGLFHGTIGSAAMGSADYMNPTDNFSQNIKRRKDIDANGFYDIIAHGKPTYIQIYHNGQKIIIDHRITASLLKHNKQYQGQGIRLLSCSTGQLNNGFAQNLANKLNRPVKAPTDILWALPNGVYYVTAGKFMNGNYIEDFRYPGKFKTFYPQRGKINA